MFRLTMCSISQCGLSRTRISFNEYLPVPVDPELVKREAAAGAFAVDLVAEDVDGETIIIENQLERSNHDHLGTVITYTAALSAKVAVWIVSILGTTTCVRSAG
jgi:hypothetical protein